MVSVDYFRQELVAQLGRATAQGKIDYLLSSGELYRAVGGYPGSSHGMPSCCDAMQAEMEPRDILLVERTDGPGMTVRYMLPRNGPDEGVLAA
jgi:hypothetical protein